MTQSEVIEIEWDQIREIEGKAANTEELGISQSWEIVDTTEASEATTQRVDLEQVS